MKRLASIFILLLALRARAADLPLTDGSRIAFLGHSLTIEPTGLWADYVSCYLVLMNPDKHITPMVIAHSGMGIDGEFGTNTDITLQEYPKYVVPFLSPTSSGNFVFFMFGGAGAPDTYQAQSQYLIDTYIVGTSAATPLIIGMTPEPDETGYALGGDFDSAGEAAAGAYSPNKIFTTTWSGLVTRFQNPANWDALKFDPIGDPSNVHPSKAANIAVAWTNIIMLGWETNVTPATIDGSALTVSSTNHCTIRSLAGTSSSFSFIKNNLRWGWGIDEAGRADATNIWPEMIGWQNDRLTITNLPTGTFRVFINGTFISNVTSAQFAAGWNMADLTIGPAHDVAQATLTAFRDLQDLDHTTLTGLNTTKGWSQLRGACRPAYEDDGERGTNLINDSRVQAALTSIATLSDAMHAAAQPQDLTFTIEQIIPRFAPFKIK